MLSFQSKVHLNCVIIFDQRKSVTFLKYFIIFLNVYNLSDPFNFLKALSSVKSVFLKKMFKIW